MMLDFFCRNSDCDWAAVIPHKELLNPQTDICPKCGSKTYMVAPENWHDPDTKVTKKARKSA